MQIFARLKQEKKKLQKILCDMLEHLAKVRAATMLGPKVIQSVIAFRQICKAYNNVLVFVYSAQ